MELLVAMFLGLFLLTGLAMLTARSSSSFNELQQSSERIENGRYAVAQLVRKLNHSGFYGHYYEMGEYAGGALPIPCTTDLATLVG